MFLHVLEQLFRVDFSVFPVRRLFFKVSRLAEQLLPFLHGTCVHPERLAGFLEGMALPVL